MVASRERVQSAGLFDPVTEALTRELARALPGAARTLVDLGGGTGHYAAACLQAPDLALDVAVSLDLPVPFINGRGFGVLFHGVHALTAESAQRRMESADTRKQVDEGERCGRGGHVSQLS